MRTYGVVAVAAVLAGMAGSALGVDGPQVVFVEAEGFNDLGGWVVDQQFMDEMGSPYVLAHGLGVPVKDATTSVTFPKPGTYRLWVRTRDWVAPWKAPGAPGRFQVLVDGKAVRATFGAEGAKWHWQDGGTVEIVGQQATVALHDLTGFEGRCDAVVFASDAAFRPPEELKELRAWRCKVTGLPAVPPDGGKYDLVVVGGGIAGTCAALSAARLGLTVALVQDRPVLGGNNSSEVRVWLNGKTNFAPYPRIGDVVGELDQKFRAHYGPGNTAELYEDDRKTAIVRAEKNITLMLSHRGNGVEIRDGKIAAVVAQHIVSGRRVRLACAMVADCTGHGVIGALAGADFDMTLKGHMGRCNLWNVAKTAGAVPFPRCPWALDLSKKPFPGREKAAGLKSLGVWYWESGFDHDPFARGEYIRDWNFRAMYGAWDALKNVDRAYGDYKLNWAAYISGPRESRRLLGDVVLTKAHVMGGKTWPDACVPCTWSIDLHLPNTLYVKGFEGDAFISKAHHERFTTPYWLPYRCLYSRNVENLFMAGRDISVTHEALGTVRVMRTCGMTGEVVGMAAALARKHRTTPRGVYERHLDELKALMGRGVGKDPPAKPSAAGPAAGPSVPVPAPPAWVASAGENLARKATVSVSSSYDGGKYKAGHLNDGDAAPVKNNRRWLSDDTPPHRVELTWTQPVTVNAVRIVAGWNSGGRLSGVPEAFSLQYDVAGQWKDIPGGKVAGNRRADWTGHFAPIATRRLRLTVTATPGGIARIWELEAYDVPKPQKTPSPPGRAGDAPAASTSLPGRSRQLGFLYQRSEESRS